jgi:magnesium-transporting ATPase (P-type)
MLARKWPAFGRRRGWILGGWVLAMGMLVVLALIAPGLAKEGSNGFGMYSVLVMGVCAAFMFCDVSGDGMSMELSKFESKETRGFILASGQLYRFIANMASNSLGFLINGSTYNRDSADAFPFQVSFGAVHFILIGLVVPFFIAMCVLLKDPPPPRKSHDETLNTHGVRGVWKVVQSFAVFMLIMNNVTNITLAGFANPATSAMQIITSPSTLMILTGNVIGMGLFSIGVWLFRNYFMNVNWRYTLFWTNCFNIVNIALFFPMIYNWAGAQNGWFISIAPSILNVIVGIAQVLTSLAVVEISPPGMEATVYEFLTTVHNAAITLNGVFSSDFICWIGISGITNTTTYMDEQAHYNKQMDVGSWWAMAVVAVGTALAFVTLPKDKDQCHDWLNKKSWQNAGVGCLNLAIALIPAWWALVRVFQKLFNGGEGGSQC